MTFKIHAVYKQASVVQKPVKEETETSNDDRQEVDDVKELSLSSSSSQNKKAPAKTLQQLRADVLNSRSTVKPGTKSAIRKSAFEGGYESDMY
jgi:hypothetical protein